MQQRVQGLLVFKIVLLIEDFTHLVGFNLVKEPALVTLTTLKMRS